MFSLNIFGKKTVDKKCENSLEKNIIVISQLKNQVSLLEKRNDHLSTKMKILLEEIQKIASVNKKQALVLLDKRKQHENEIQKNNGMIHLLEKQISSLENSMINNETIKALQMGKTFIDISHRNMNIDNVEDLLNDIDDQKEISNSISDLFIQRLDNVYENEELLDELNDYILGKPNFMEKPNLPDVPTYIVNKSRKEEEKKEEEEIIERIRSEMLL